MNGLAGLLEEWRKRAVESGAMNAGPDIALCVKQLNPFVERLKGLEQEMAYRCGDHCRTNCEMCARRAELHALIYGEQP